MTTTADAATASPPSKPQHRGGWTHRLGLDKYSALYLWGGFMIFFGLTQDQFLTATSFKLVLTEKVVVGVLALAFLIPLTCDTFDLSIGHVMGFSMVITTALAKNTGLPQGLNALIALAACALVGAVSGFIVVRLGVNSFIATLGMSQVLTALNILISGNRSISGVMSEGYKNFGRKKLMFGLPAYFYMLILLAIICWYVLEQTPLGRYMFATGGNREAARLAGVKTNRLTWGSLIVSALIAGFAGLIHTWKVGTYDPGIGPANTFAAVAAVFFGASQLVRRPNVWGTLIAVYALAFGVKGLQLTFTKGITWIEPAFQGTALLLAVAFASRNNVIRVRRRKPPEAVAGTEQYVA